MVQTAVERAPDVPLNKLESWAAAGATLELRQAAGAALGERLLEAEVGIDKLMEMAIQGASPQLGQALSRALGERFKEDMSC